MTVNTIRGKSLYLLFFTLLLMTLTFTLPLMADYTSTPILSKKTTNLINDVHHSLDISKEEIAQHPNGEIFERINSIQKKFYELPRHTLPHAELVEVKYLMQHWRYQMKEKIINAFPLISESPKEQITALNLLSRLDIILTANNLREIRRSLSLNDIGVEDNFKLLVQDQGNPDLTRDYFDAVPEMPINGPLQTLPIKPVDPSQWPYAKWSENEIFSNYYRDGQGRVYFRGHFFENGDIVVVNQMNNMEGTFSIFTEGPGYFTHSGIYVEMEKDGKKYPSVFEIHTQGTRLVPLNIFFSNSFMSYAEIYRVRPQHKFSLKNQSQEVRWQEKMPAIIQEIDSKPHGYNFYGDSKYSQDDRYLTCTQLVEVALSKAGALSEFNQCKLTTKSHKMLLKLNFEATSLLTPTSFVRNPHLQMVGAFDSGLIKTNLAKEIVLSRLNHDINAGTFVVENLQDTILYKASAFYLVQTPYLAPMILRFAGNFTTASLPIGPVGMMSVILPLDMASASATKKVMTEFDDILSRYTHASTPLLFSNLLKEDKIRNGSDDIFSFFEQHYVTFDNDLDADMDFTSFWF